MYARRFCSILIYLLVCSLVGVRKTAPATADTGKLTGQVADLEESAPIRYAFIYVHGFGGVRDTVVKVDSKGNFEVSLPPGIYSVFVAADGFAPTCKSVSIDKGTTTRFSPRLRADTENSQP